MLNEESVMLTEEAVDKIYSLLVEEAGAPEVYRGEFICYFPAPKDLLEFRFQGRLGFGGKIFKDRRRLYVNCYAEDKTPERETVIERVNLLLGRIAGDPESWCG